MSPCPIRIDAPGTTSGRVGYIVHVSLLSASCAQVHLPPRGVTTGLQSRRVNIRRRMHCTGCVALHCGAERRHAAYCTTLRVDSTAT